MFGGASVDIAVVGAGAAGLMTAIAAARTESSLNIILLDSRPKIGAKILMSGGTRCNVTNRRVTPSDYQGGPSSATKRGGPNRHFVKHVLEAFTPEQTLRFFYGIGVELVVEPSGKYFPVTNSGKTVLEALMKECTRVGVTFTTGVKIAGIRKDGENFKLTGLGLEQPLFARRVVLATGGLSYPETGSDGSGFSIAGKLGHSVTPTAAALTPLLTDDKDWVTLSGVTLDDVKLSFFSEGRKCAESRGGFLFAHFGFSGPAALDISRHYAYTEAKSHPIIEADFLPGQNEEVTARLLEEFSKKHPMKTVKSFFIHGGVFPERLINIFLKKAGLTNEKRLRELSKRDKAMLAREIRHCPLPVTGVYGYKKAEVTAGGIDLREVNVSTMASKKVPGLYFTGEILDMDGRIGGFNFQWAWSTGQIAGRSAAASLKTC